MEDARIVELYLERKEEAITATARKYGNSLNTIAYNLLEDPQMAEECENDTYLAAWNAIPPHTPWNYLFAFLARITRHISLDRCKERSRLKRGGQLAALTAEMEQCIPGPERVEEQVDGILLAETIGAFLKGLPEERRNIFLRRYWYMDSVSTIAQRFGFRESKVKTMLFRTRNELRHHLQKGGYAL